MALLKSAGDVCTAELRTVSLTVVLLTLSILVRTDGGKVSAKTSQTSSTATSSIHSNDLPPQFVAEPQSAVVRRDDVVSLNCSAGPPGVDVVWRFNESLVSERRVRGISVEGGTLRISSFSRELHAGVYHCVASNILGSVLSRPAWLTEASLNGFVDDSHSTQGLTVFDGNAVIVPCPQSSSIPPALIEFQLNGSKLELSGRHKILPSGNLLIDGVNVLLDQGLYSCAAINPVSRLRRQASRSISLVVLAAPAQNVSARIVTTSSTRIQVVRGDTLSLECSADGWPRPDIQWSHYGGHLPRDRYSQTSGVLTIRHTDRRDAGTYVCQAENSAGQSQLRTVFVDVLVPPVIMLPPQSQKAGEGVTVILNCMAEGVPQATVTWLHNTLPLPTSVISVLVDDSRDSMLDSRLTLVRFNRQQAGVYQCIVHNAVGATYAVAVLYVDDERSVHNTMQNVAPYSTRPERSTHRPAASNMATGQHDPVRNRLLSDRSYSAQRRPDTGRKLKAKAGELRLIPPPKPTVHVTSDTSVMLRWTALANEVLFVKVQYKRIGKRRVDSGWKTVDEDLPSTKQSLEVSGLQAGGTYRFRLVAVYANHDNKHGQNSRSVQLKSANKRSKAPITGPLIVEVKAISADSIVVAWQYDPTEQVVIEGFIVEYRLYDRETEPYMELRVRDVDTRHVLLEHLLPDVSYSIRMQSFNAHGRSAFSNTAVTKTLDSSNDAQNFTEIDFQDFPILSNPNPPPRGSHVTHVTSSSSAGAQPYIVDARQENDTLFVIIGVICGAVVIGVACVLFVCFRRQKQQRLLLAALHQKIKQPVQTVVVSGTSGHTNSDAGNQSLVQALPARSQAGNVFTCDDFMTRGVADRSLQQMSLSYHQSSVPCQLPEVVSSQMLENGCSSRLMGQSNGHGSYSSRRQQRCTSDSDSVSERLLPATAANRWCYSTPVGEFDHRQYYVRSAAAGPVGNNQLPSRDGLATDRNCSYSRISTSARQCDYSNNRLPSCVDSDEDLDKQQLDSSRGSGGSGSQNAAKRVNFVHHYDFPDALEDDLSCGIANEFLDQSVDSGRSESSGGGTAIVVAAAGAGAADIPESTV